MIRVILFFVILGVLVGAIILLGTLHPTKQQSFHSTPSLSITPGSEKTSQQVVAKGLQIPWALVFLPDGEMLVTERTGTVRIIDKNGTLSATPAVKIPVDLKPDGEGGLLGITIDPDFKSNNFVYLYYTYSSTGTNTLNRVVKMIYKNNTLSNEDIIVDKIPGSLYHNGGRIKFGPDGYLYVTTGDAQAPSQAQSKTTLGGKILRVKNDGTMAPDNPFNNRIYSYGHRNPQGLAWNSEGDLWATEHGRTSPQSGLDELNLISSGKNYGWPTIQGDETKSGMETPKLNSGNDTWAPAGAVFIGNSLFFGGLKVEALYEATIKGSLITNLQKHLNGKFGRIRDVELGPDGKLYITTSNRDGRGTPKSGDDKIIKLDPKSL